MTSFVSAARADGPHRVLHGFLDGPRPIFGSYHAPARPFRDIAYVVCPPHGWEAIQSYEGLRILADELSTAGFPTLRLHYDGTNESIGSDEDPGRVAAWTESIRRAVAGLGALPGVKGVGLIGLRLGATLAATVAAEIPVASLVLWEPAVAGAHYTREMEILASASPRAIQGARGEGPRGIEAGGYLLTAETIEALGKLDLQQVEPQGSPDVLVVCRDDRPPLFAKKLVEHLVRKGSRATLEQLPGHKEMLTYPERSKPAEVILRRIRDWAVERSQPLAGGVEPGAPALAGEATAEKIRRRPVRFGPASRLFGVLTEPAEGKATKPPVLFLTGGVVPRTSVNGMYLVLAARLAERGHAVLRMDVSGICESAPADGATPNDPHAASLLGDVRAGVDLLLAHTGQRSLKALGLCSGAYAAFQTALADERVQSIVLLNPQVFHLEAGSPRFSETEQAQAAKYYRQSLMSLAAWKKLLSGKANVRYITGFVGARIKTKLKASRERIAAKITKAPQGLAGDFHRLLGRGLALRIVMAEGEPGHEPLLAQLGADRERLETMGFVLKMTPGPDHTFNDFSVRAPLLDWLTEALCENASTVR